MKIYHVPDYQNVVQILKDEADSQTTYTECASHVLPTINGWVEPSVIENHKLLMPQVFILFKVNKL